MKIGLIGCGSIGQFLLQKINEEKLIPQTEIIAVFDEREKSVDKLRSLSEQYIFEHHQELSTFLQAPTDLVIECANIQSVHDYAVEIVEKKNLLVISIGALADDSLHGELARTAKLNAQKVYLPTGAIGGLDMIKAANSMGGLEKVTLISRKPLAALVDENLKEEATLFKGSAREAIKRFPKNANVAIALSLAGIGTEKTAVHIIADPNVTRNIHTIQVEGSFGQAEISVENNPSPTNPKTSYLTALSVLSTIQALEEQIIIG